METTAKRMTPVFQIQDFSFSYPEEETKALLNPTSLKKFMVEKMRVLNRSLSQCIKFLQNNSHIEPKVNLKFPMECNINS